MTCMGVGLRCLTNRTVWAKGLPRWLCCPSRPDELICVGSLRQRACIWKDKMEIRITRKNPGCIAFLLDRSGSMGRRVKGGGTLADAAAMLVNAALEEIYLRSQYEAEFRHLFDVAVLGYGFTPGIGVNSVASALGGDFAGVALYSPAELARNRLLGQGFAWVTPVYGGRTPMCRAFDRVGGLLYDWARIHVEAAPPVVINVSDGLVTDSPYEGGDLETWHSRLSGIATSQGVVKVFDLVLTPDADQPILRPATTSSLAHPGWTVFQAATFLRGVETSLWASSSWLKAEDDRASPEFLRHAELTDDSIPGMVSDGRA